MSEQSLTQTDSFSRTARQKTAFVRKKRAPQREGQSSFMKSLFFGEIREDLLFPYPVLSSDSKEMLRMVFENIHRFSKDQVDSKAWDETGKLPIDRIRELSEMGFMGIAVPEEYSGMGLSQSAYARVMQELAAVDSSLALTLGAHQSIGYKALLLFGTDEQKKQFLPRLARGELIACYCLTEAGSGSDAASIQTRATLTEDGKYYLLNGSKLWITNAGIANFFTVFAKTEAVVRGEKKDRVTCFVVDRSSVVNGTDWGSVEVGPSEDKLGIRASWTNAVHLDNVKVPVENVVGGLGYGFKVAMGVLNHGRLGLAAGCVGVGKKCLMESSSHVNSRVQFKKKLREFGLIQEKISRMTTNLYAAESMVYMTTALIDQKNVDYSLESAIAKIFATEALWEIADENLQIWGGAGYMKEYPHERILRDVRINRIFEGTNEVLRAFVALSGMQGPGEELAGLADAIKFPLKGLGQATGFAIRRLKRTIVGESISEAHPSLKKFSSVIEDVAGEFAAHVDVLLRRHGREIFLKQFAQKRVADVAIDLYAMACVLSRVNSQVVENQENYELELAIAESFFDQANRRVRENFSAMTRNVDESKKLVSEKICDQGAYPFDVL